MKKIVYILISSMISLWMIISPVSANENIADNHIRFLNTDSYVVVFDTDDDRSFDEFDKITVMRGKTITNIPEDPKRDGYVFKGWYYATDEHNNPIYWNFKNDIVQDDITLWSAWEKGYTVVFDINDEHNNAELMTIVVPTNNTIKDIPTDPLREGYTFKGWLYSQTEDGKSRYWDFSKDIVSKDITLLASWEKSVTTETEESGKEENAPSTQDSNDIKGYVVLIAGSTIVLLYLYSKRGY